MAALLGICWVFIGSFIGKTPHFSQQIPNKALIKTQSGIREPAYRRIIRVLVIPALYFVYVLLPFS